MTCTLSLMVLSLRLASTRLTFEDYLTLALQMFLYWTIKTPIKETHEG